MKKTLLTLAAFSAFFAASAQIKNDRGTFDKPVAGSLAVEIQVSPNLTGAGTFSLNDMFLANIINGADIDAVKTNVGTTLDPKLAGGMLKGRYFLSDKMAIRAQLSIVASSNNASNEVGGSTVKEKVATTGFGLIAGVEKHFTGAERLSTYAGADVLVGVGTVAAKSSGTETLKSSNTGVGFGLRAVTGFDYYFIPKVYLGAELGLGLGFNSYGVVKASGGTLENGKSKTSSFEFAPFVQPMIRLGYRF